jgi:bilin biosynthesis protein
VIGALAKVVQEEPSQLGLETERLKSLVQALDDEAAMVRCEAAAALGNCAYPPAVPRLINLLHHPDWETRKAVALALMKMGDCQALSPLRAACLEESDTAVQKVLRLAISQLEKTMEG